LQTLNFESQLAKKLADSTRPFAPIAFAKLVHLNQSLSRNSVLSKFGNQVQHHNRNNVRLFPGLDPFDALTARQFNRAVHDAAKVAKIDKRVEELEQIDQDLCALR
jgi:hypothetical protein